MTSSRTMRLTGRSRAVARVRRQLRVIAAGQSPVLLEGERGTGKGRIARLIHRAGRRRNAAFVWVNCAALDAERIEAELFGSQRPGTAIRAGAFERADHGTLYLDHIEALPAATQLRLLRVLLENTIDQVEGKGPRSVDVRLVASTHEDLAAAEREGRFRSDLRSRLALVTLRLPPLRERVEDIPLLVERFVAEFNREYGRRIPGVSRGVLERLLHHPWPGNVRELRATLEAMVAGAGGDRLLDVPDLPAPLHVVGGPASEPLELAVGMTVADAERRLIRATLRHTGGDKPRAAAILGIGLRTLYRKIGREAPESRPLPPKPPARTRR